MKKELLIALFALTPALALAEGAPVADVADSLAPPTCKKPVLVTQMRKADDTSDFDEKADAYKDCINAYTDAQNKLAQKHIEAGNKAIADFNAFAKESNEKRKHSDDQ